MAQFVNYLAFLCLFVAFAHAADPSTTPAPVTPLGQNITIYYEPLCPDSVKLIRQLASEYDTLVKPYFNLTLVPFGRATVIENPFSMNCSHGPFECEGDRVHSCVILRVSLLDLASKIKFINCTMNPEFNSLNGSHEFNTTQCESIIGVTEAKEVVSCSNSSSSEEYIRHYSTLTKVMQAKIPNAGVPVVVFNTDFDLGKSKDAASDLKSALCSRISGNKPSACGTDPKPGGGAAYFSGSFVLSVGLISAVHFIK